MDRAKFFAELRKRNSGVFGTSLSQRQVEGIEAILDAATGLPAPHVANILAQVYRETGGGMYPVKETVFRSHSNQNPSDSQVISRLDSAFRKGQLSWVSKPYWRDGYFGRGVIQITHASNYRKASKLVGKDLVQNPSMALDEGISAQIAVHGMRLGVFTGKKLSDFGGGHTFDHNRARAIVNGDRNKRDRGASQTVGEMIAGWGRAFEAALSSADYTTHSKPPETTPPPTPPDTPKSGLWGFLASLLRGFSRG